MRRLKVVVLRYTEGVDEYGDPIPGDYVEHLTLPAKFAPNNSTEPVEVGRNAVITGGTVYIRGLPAPPDIVAQDRARILGADYEIEGEIGSWQRRATWGIQFAVKQVKG